MGDEGGGPGHSPEPDLPTDAAVWSDPQLAQRTLDGLDAHICVIDHGARIRLTNAAWRSFARAAGEYGTGTGEGVNYLEALAHSAASGDREAQQIQVDLRELLQGRREVVRHEYPCSTPQRKLWFLMVARPLSATRLSRTPVGAVIAHVDITDRYEAEQAATAIAEDLRQANRAKSDVLLAASHDLRNHLNGAQGFQEILAQTELTAEQRRYLNHSQIALQQLQELTRMLVELAQLERGQLCFAEEPLDILHVMEQQKELLTLKAQQKDLDLTVESGQLEVHRFLGDEQRLGQIMYNLATNALRYTDEGSVTIRVSGGLTGPVLLEVMDTGSGLSEAERRTIFDRFSRGRADVANRAPEGLGLDLAICTELAAAMGGEIEVRNSGSGAHFTVRLPLKPLHRQ